MRRLFLLLLLPPLASVGGCSGNPLGAPQFPNVVDTVILGALVGTPISVPSAYSISAGAAVRTDQTSQFDFAYNVDPAGRRVFLPAAVLGLTSTTAPPGFLPTSDAFDQIDRAPLNGYLTFDTIPIAVGDRFIVRGRVACSVLGVPLYAKLQVLSFDDADRQVTFQVLANRNCGFRSLRPGTPED